MSHARRMIHGDTWWIKLFDCKAASQACLYAHLGIASSHWSFNRSNSAIGTGARWRGPLQDAAQPGKKERLASRFSWVVQLAQSVATRIGSRWRRELTGQQLRGTRKSGERCEEDRLVRNGTVRAVLWPSHQDLSQLQRIYSTTSFGKGEPAPEWFF